MIGSTLDYTYNYSQPSTITADSIGQRVSLATSSRVVQPAMFFRGSLTQPRKTADLLLALMRVVHSRFYLPPAMLAKIHRLADPVVTCGEDRIRFEAFSACCGVYGRVDLLPGAIDGTLVSTGTTNVDFNPPMCAALTRLQDSQAAMLTVGAGEVSLESRGQTVTERKVALPIRWLKGFVEVQAHQARMHLGFELSGAELRRFMESVPRKSGRDRTLWIVPSGSGVRLSAQANKGAVKVGGIERLRVLEEMVRHARSVRVYTSEDSQASVREADCGSARLTVALSPDCSRGFSGEGQVLDLLTDQVPDADIERVRTALDWSPRVDIVALSRQCGLSLESAEACLARLGTRGLVGYDLAERAYFHRELPFDLEAVEQLQPRLLAARALVTDGGVKIEEASGGTVVAWVRGTDCEHRVTINFGVPRCTCPWFSKHGVDRGPCKHILAVQLASGDNDDA